MQKSVTIIGGNQETTFKKIGKKMGCRVHFHNGLAKGSAARQFERLVKQGDCVIIMLGAISHPTMEQVKTLCKKMNKPLLFHNTCGASGAMNLAMEWFQREELVS